MIWLQLWSEQLGSFTKCVRVNVFVKFRCINLRHQSWEFTIGHLQIYFYDCLCIYISFVHNKSKCHKQSCQCAVRNKKTARRIKRKGLNRLTSQKIKTGGMIHEDRSKYQHISAIYQSYINLMYIFLVALFSLSLPHGWVSGDRNRAWTTLTWSLSSVSWSISGFARKRRQERTGGCTSCQGKSRTCWRTLLIEGVEIDTQLHSNIYWHDLSFESCIL